MKKCDFFSCRKALLHKCLQNALPEPPRDPTAASRGAKIEPKSPQDLSGKISFLQKIFPERALGGFFRIPGRSPPQPLSGKIFWSKKIFPERPLGLQGAILEPFCLHFGPSGASFSKVSGRTFPSFSCCPHRLFSCALCSALRLLSASGSAPSARWPVLGRMPL